VSSVQSPAPQVPPPETIVRPGSDGAEAESRSDRERDDPAHSVCSGGIAVGSSSCPGSPSTTSTSPSSTSGAIVPLWPRGRFHASWSRSHSLTSTAARAASVSVSVKDRAANALLPFRLRPGATRVECSSGGASCVRARLALTGAATLGPGVPRRRLGLGMSSVRHPRLLTKGFVSSRTRALASRHA